MSVLITGSAGFIGMSVTSKMLEKNYKIVGVDNLNSYYDVSLKKDRNNVLKKFKNYKFYNLDISKNIKKLNYIIKENNITSVIHFAAQANVRYSLKNPKSYINNNIVGFYNILESCRKFKIKKLIFASSSSVYGKNYKHKKIFSEKDRTDEPKNLYAATKKSNEILAYAYADLFKINIIGLRFFTVYGPWGRPDMAPFLFINSIINKKKINVFNSGKMSRDFTYIDDVVNGVIKIFKSKKNGKYFDIYNIGRGKSIKLQTFISTLENILKTKSKKKLMPFQKGDMIRTLSNINKLKKEIKYSPKTSLKVGLLEFCKWYVDYYKIKNKKIE